MVPRVQFQCHCDQVNIDRLWKTRANRDNRDPQWQAAVIHRLGTLKGRRTAGIDFLPSGPFSYSESYVLFGNEGAVQPPFS